MLRSRATRLALSVALVALGAGVAQARHDAAYLRDVTTKLETPHLTWAKPYARGPLRVLFVTARTVAPREIVELWQRADIEFTVFTMAHSGLMSFESDAGAAPYDLAVEGTSIEEKTEELLGKLEREYDAFVFANASLDVLPTEAQYKILKRVSEGAGLLFTFGRQTRLALFSKPITEDRERILTGAPLSGLDFLNSPETLTALNAKTPEELPDRLVETFAFKQGRIAVLNWGAGSSTYYGGHGLTPPETYSLNWPANCEEYLSLVFRTLLWTVPAKQPQVWFGAALADGAHFDRAGPTPRLSIELHATKPLQVTIETEVRDKTNAPEFAAKQGAALQNGVTNLEVELPRLKAGGHFAHLIVRSDAGIENWATVGFVVDSALSLTAFGADSEFHERGEPTTVNATLSQGAPAGAKLRISLTDTAGRVYLKQDTPFPVGQTTASLQVSLDGACTIASKLHGELIVGDEVYDARDQFLFVPRRTSDEFRTVLWGGVGCGNTGLGWLAYQSLRRAGFNAILAHPSSDGSQERSFALNDFPLVSYSYRVMGGADEKGWRKDHWVKDVEDGCFYNPELQQKAKESCVGRTQPAIPYGPTLYSLGDENYFDYASGFSPIGQQAFREYLKRHYASLEELNRVWGTQYKDWAEVQLLKREEALKQNLWPLIHEHMGFNETEYADYHHFLVAALKEADPHARVGAEGSVPGDLEKTLEGMDIWGPYSDKLGNELLRSLAKTDLVRGNWWGGYVGSHGGRTGALPLWKQLLGGAVNTSLYFAAIGSEGMLTTDLSYADFFEQTLPELREIYGGMGQLISSAEVPADGIAILWSQATEHSATLFSSLGSPSASQGNLLGLLDNAGYGYRYVTTHMVEAGALKQGYRVLFLPASQAISDAEAQAIRDFANAGGVVIADTACGLLDGHCRPLWVNARGAWRGQLDDLFGLTRSSEPKPVSATGAVSATFEGHTLQLADFPFRLDASLSGTPGALGQVGEQPVFIGRSVGRGRAILLNFPFPTPEHPQGVGLVRGLLGAAGLTPACKLTDAKGYFFRRFRQGDLTLIGVVRLTETAGDTTLKLAERAYLYDVRAGKALGKADAVSLARKDPAVRLFAALPAAVGKVTVQAPAEAKRGETVAVRVRLDSGAAKPAGRLLRVQALRPNGEECLVYRAFLTLTTNETEARVPFALNDPGGAWTIVATDVATGAGGKGTVTVR
ncbi:MAG: hypothetical protein FJX75_06505 [Armatimonadetes bacterium]|nr:hypothetical protein [Armatimonadota bacterium]